MVNEAREFGDVEVYERVYSGEMEFWKDDYYISFQRFYGGSVMGREIKKNQKGGMNVKEMWEWFFTQKDLDYGSRGEVVGDRKDLYLIVDLSAKLLRDKGITGFYYQGTRDWKDYQRMYNQMVVDHSDKDLYKKGLEYLSIVKRLYSSKGVVIDNDSMKMMYMYVMHMNERISGENIDVDRKYTFPYLVSHTKRSTSYAKIFERAGCKVEHIENTPYWYVDISGYNSVYKVKYIPAPEE